MTYDKLQFFFSALPSGYFTKPLCNSLAKESEPFLKRFVFVASGWSFLSSCRPRFLWTHRTTSKKLLDKYSLLCTEENSSHFRIRKLFTKVPLSPSEVDKKRDNGNMNERSFYFLCRDCRTKELFSRLTEKKILMKEG